MVFCHFELHLNAGSSLSGIQCTRYKEKLQKVPEKKKNPHVKQSICIVAIQHQTQDAFHIEKLI